MGTTKAQSIMPLYEFVLRTPGRPDEVRVSDSNSLRKGDEIIIANQVWVVAHLDRPRHPRRDGVAVRHRLTLHRRESGLAQRP
jgi:hypothetical protein